MKTDRLRNLFTSFPSDPLCEEFVEAILAKGNVRIERILSRGHASPEGFVYCQEEDEFVLLLKGSATLSFGHEKCLMKSGDWVIIPSGEEHRVEETASDEDTVWLTVYISDKR